MMNIREFLKNNILILDGGMGTLLQKEGIHPGEHPENWNITHGGVIEKIHRAERPHAADDPENLLFHISLLPRTRKRSRKPFRSAR